MAIPKRSSQRLGHDNYVDQWKHLAKIELPGDIRPIPMPMKIDKETGEETDEPVWHQVAVNFYAALEYSAQVQFYEPSDWALAYQVAENLSREMEPQVVGVNEAGKPIWARRPMSGGSHGALLKAMSMLMVSEADRRRAQIEITRVKTATKDSPEDQLEKRRKALGR